MNVIGYVRVSTDGQAQDGVSLDAQEAKIKACAELNGATSVLMFRDAGISGKRADNRPGLQNALQSTGTGDALVVYSLSRLARSTKDTLAIAELLEKRQANLISVSERIDTTTAAGKMVFRLLAVLSEFERDQAAERIRMALQYKRSNGEKTGGTLPYGYQVDDGRLIEDDNERQTISLISELHRTGYSLREIAGRLHRLGVSTKTGLTRWNPTTIAAIVRRHPAAV